MPETLFMFPTFYDVFKVLLLARHLKICGWTLSICFFKEKRDCPKCKKVRSELIEWICPTSPHITLELSWWINRLSEITTVLS